MVILFLAGGAPRTILIIVATVVSIRMARTDLSTETLYIRGSVGLLAGFLSIGMLPHFWSFCCVCLGYAGNALWPVVLKKKVNPALNIWPDVQTALMAVGDVSHGLLVIGPIVAGWIIGLFIRARYFPEVV